MDCSVGPKVAWSRKRAASASETRVRSRAGAGAGGLKTAEPLLRTKPPASSPAGFRAVSIATVTRPAFRAAIKSAVA